MTGQQTFREARLLSVCELHARTLSEALYVHATEVSAPDSKEVWRMQVLPIRAGLRGQSEAGVWAAAPHPLPHPARALRSRGQ